jgi:hypothetical protein
MKTLDSVLSRLSPRGALWLNRGLSLGMGLLVAFIMHYVLFRIALPSAPFIYVAF